MNRKPHAHPIESEFEHWTRQWRRRERIRRALFWIALFCAYFIVGALVVRGLTS